MQLRERKKSHERRVDEEHSAAEECERERDGDGARENKLQFVFVNFEELDESQHDFSVLLMLEWTLVLQPYTHTQIL